MQQYDDATLAALSQAWHNSYARNSPDDYARTIVAPMMAARVAATPGISGARAAGGPVTPLGTYLVGENGPETITQSTTPAAFRGMAQLPQQPPLSPIQTPAGPPLTQNLQPSPTTPSTQAPAAPIPLAGPFGTPQVPQAPIPLGGPFGTPQTPTSPSSQPMNVNALAQALSSALSTQNPNLNLNGLLGSSGSIYGGGRAGGGPVEGGQTYTVGENGPELITMPPGTSGYVTPNQGQGPSAYERAVNALHGAVQATDPFGGASNMPISNGADVSRVIGRGLTTAAMGIPAVAGVSALMDAAGNLMPSSTGAEADLSAQQNLIDRAKKLIGTQRPESFPDAVQEWQDKNDGRSPPPKVLERLKAVNADRQQTLTTQQGQWDESLKKALSTVRQSDFSQASESEQQPFAVRHPYIDMGVNIGAPALSLLTGLKFGSMAGKAFARGQPGRGLLYASGGPVFGGLEGDLGQAFLLNQDLRQPRDSQTFKDAAGQLPAWLPETGPINRYNWGPYLSDRATNQALMSGGIGSLATVGRLPFAAANETKALNALSSSPAAAPTGNVLAQPAPAAAPAAGNAARAANPIYTDSSGRDVFLGKTGKPMFKDSAGRWRYAAPGAKMVHPDHQP